MSNGAIGYFSTNQAVFGSPDLEQRISDRSLHTVGFAEAIITGQAPDGGLFMPTKFPLIDLKTIGRMKEMPYSQIFVETMKHFFDGVLSKETLERIAKEAYTFEPFIEQISKSDYIARLDEGPTAAFKDYAAQVLFRTIEALMKEEPKTEIEFRRRLRDIKLLTFIVATSGDTGSAMGEACLNREKMWMAILHSAYIPEHVSEQQAKQMDTLGNNVHVIRVKTDFDGCASIATKLQLDPELEYMHRNSANSVNIGRLVPQIAYYFFAYSRIAKNGEEVVFSVPSGNFGNAVAGLYAARMGLPIKLVIAVNENDVFHRFYRTGKYEPSGNSHPSPSNAMNVDNPSNVRRLFQLYGGQLIGKEAKKLPDMQRLREEIAAYRVSDAETDEIIERFYKESHMIGQLHSTLEPHGAVAWGGAKKFREERGYDGKIIAFETAHPGKFPERLKTMGIEPELPECLAKLAGKPHGRFHLMDNDYGKVKELVKKLYEQERRRAA